LIGITGAISAGRLLSSLLFGVRPHEGLILTIAVGALRASSFLAAHTGPDEGALDNVVLRAGG